MGSEDRGAANIVMIPHLPITHPCMQERPLIRIAHFFTRPVVQLAVRAVVTPHLDFSLIHERNLTLSDPLPVHHDIDVVLVWGGATLTVSRRAFCHIHG